MKKCSKCKVEQELDQFHKNKNAKDGFSYQCKTCRGAYIKVYISTDKAKKRNRERNKKYYDSTHSLEKARAKRYGITVEHLRYLLNKNNGICIICEARPAEVIDHCHLTMKVRGAICNNCNKGIGMFRDQPTWMHRAAYYIEAWDKLLEEEKELKIEFVTKEEYIARLAKPGEGTKLIP